MYWKECVYNFYTCYFFLFIFRWFSSGVRCRCRRYMRVVFSQRCDFYFILVSNTEKKTTQIIYINCFFGSFPLCSVYTCGVFFFQLLCNLFIFHYRTKSFFNFTINLLTIETCMCFICCQSNKNLVCASFFLFFWFCQSQRKHSKLLFVIYRCIAYISEKPDTDSITHSLTDIVIECIKECG